jgi:putative membrane protein
MQDVELGSHMRDKFCNQRKMPQTMLSFLKRWLITTVAVWLAASFVPGISYTPPGLLLAGLLLGLLNAIVRPVMIVLSLPLLVLTLGLFMLVINAVLLWSVGSVLKDFHVDGFAPAFWGSLIISLTSLVLNFLTKSNSPRVEFKVGKPPGRRPPNDDGGPVIDV